MRVEEESVDEGADLIDAGAERGRDDDADELPDPGVMLRPAKLEDNARALAGGQQQAELQHAADGNRDGQRGRGDFAADAARRSAREASPG